MNIIENQADEFCKHFLPSNPGSHPFGSYQAFIDRVRNSILQYYKPNYKLEFVARVNRNTKKIADAHDEICPHKKTGHKCSSDEFYQNALFFLQQEIDYLRDTISPSDFSESEKKSIDTTLEKVLSDLNDIKLGQELTYKDVIDEIYEIRDLYYLNKKNWTQLLIGKLTELVAGGILSETLSKQIIEEVQKNYKSFIG